MYDSLSSPERYADTVQRSARRSTCDDAIALVARHRKVPIRLLMHKSRSRLPTARARQLAMYLSHVVLGRSLKEVGEAFGRDRTTVSYACALVEDMRDDLRFDEEVCELERQLEAGLVAAYGSLSDAA
ncbi:helix-turn-helix domain-containing protein [Devosia sp. 2618]|uniref:helix-turn-helix domain-containing protein n=1 Tax=Devosia sp. 2618 TaxID=3156454 RepID=UPI00339702B3